MAHGIEQELYRIAKVHIDTEWGGLALVLTVLHITRVLGRDAANRRESLAEADWVGQAV